MLGQEAGNCVHFARITAMTALLAAGTIAMAQDRVIEKTPDDNGALRQGALQQRVTFGNARLIPPFPVLLLKRTKAAVCPGACGLAGVGQIRLEAGFQRAAHEREATRGLRAGQRRQGSGLGPGQGPDREASRAAMGSRSTEA